jgi:hypothetical protein
MKEQREREPADAHRGRQAGEAGRAADEAETGRGSTTIATMLKARVEITWPPFGEVAAPLFGCDPLRDGSEYG